MARMNSVIQFEKNYEENINMSQGNEIKSEKILLKDVFRMWFLIPEYQRPYVWGYEEIHDLLDDLTFAAKSKPEAEYFLGSLVFQAKPADKSKEQDFDENDLLDGQQRLTTLLWFFGNLNGDQLQPTSMPLFSKCAASLPRPLSIQIPKEPLLLLLTVLRDVSEDSKIKKACQDCIYQDADKFKNLPERVRLKYLTHPEVQKFIDTYIKPDGGTNNKLLEKLAKKSNDVNDVSVSNMAKGIATLRAFLSSPDAMPATAFLKFLLNKVLLIYVSTENLEDAFRLFTILNNRGVPLRNSDILKSINLGVLANDKDRKAYAQMWEDAEGELGDDFERFLAYLRTILVKEKARLTLLQEFEDKIYNPKEKDRTENPSLSYFKKGNQLSSSSKPT